MIKTDLTQVNKTDRWLWIIYIMFVFVSALVSFSSNSQDIYRASTIYDPWIKHLTMLFIGFCIIGIMQFIPVNILRRWTPGLFWINIAAQICCFIPGVRTNNVHRVYRWISFGVGFDIQPDEYLKFTLVLYLATILLDILHSENDDKRKFLTLKYCFITLVATCLVAYHHTSTAIMFVMMATVMYFVTGLHTKLILLIGAGLIVVFGLFYGALKGLQQIKPDIQFPGRIPTVIGRVDRFIFSEPDETKYDIKAKRETAQAKYCKVSVANGNGIIGRGPGNSVERDVLPVANADCVFAIIVEEWGWLGIIVTLMLYMLLLSRVGLLVKHSYDEYMSLVALSCGLLIGFQALISILCVLDMVPATGQPLPFISVGGNSVLSMSFGMGIIMCISKAQHTEQGRVAAAARQSSEQSTPVIIFEQDSDDEPTEPGEETAEN